MTVKAFPATPRRPAEKAPSPPRNLPPDVRAWWRGLQVEYGIKDRGGLAVLEVAARAKARMDEARRLLDTEGCVVKDRWDQAKQHPAAQVEKDARAGLLAALRALNLDVEPIRDRIGRPGGR